MPILLLDRKLCFKITPAVSGRTDIVKNEYRDMSFHPIPKEHSWERKYFYPVGYFDISPFVLIARQNYRTWNFHYSWQEILTLLFFIFLGKMSTLDFLVIYMKMKCSDMPKIQKKSFYLSLLEWPEILRFRAVQLKIPRGDNGASPYRNASSWHCPIPQAHCRGVWLDDL